MKSRPRKSPVGLCSSRPVPSIFRIFLFFFPPFLPVRSCSVYLDALLGSFLVCIILVFFFSFFCAFAPSDLLFLGISKTSEDVSSCEWGQHPAAWRRRGHCSSCFSKESEYGSGIMTRQLCSHLLLVREKPSRQNTKNNNKNILIHVSRIFITYKAMLKIIH